MMPMRPPAFVTRDISATAARTSGKWCGAIRHVTRSNAPSAKGSASASAPQKTTFAAPLATARFRASDSIAGVRSEATTRATWPASAAAVCPPPVATSRIRWPAARSRPEKSRSRSSTSAWSALFRYFSATRPNRALVSSFGIVVTQPLPPHFPTRPRRLQGRVQCTGDARRFPFPPVPPVRGSLPRSRGTACPLLLRARGPGSRPGARPPRPVERTAGAPPEARVRLGGRGHGRRLRADPLRLRAPAAFAPGDLPGGAPSRADGGGGARRRARSVRGGARGLRKDRRHAGLRSRPVPDAFGPRRGVGGGRGARRGGTRGQGTGGRPEGGQVGGVEAVAGRRDQEGSGDGGDDATRGLPGGGGGFRAARLPLPRDAVRLLRFHPPAVDP